MPKLYNKSMRRIVISQKKGEPIIIDPLSASENITKDNFSALKKGAAVKGMMDQGVLIDYKGGEEVGHKISGKSKPAAPNNGAVDLNLNNAGERTVSVETTSEEVAEAPKGTKK
jgi:hypothetical protein